MDDPDALEPQAFVVVDMTSENVSAGFKDVTIRASLIDEYGATQAQVKPSGQIELVYVITPCSAEVSFGDVANFETQYEIIVQSDVEEEEPADET